MNSCKCVYVFECQGIYKIGVSENVQNRMKQLSCSFPNISCIYFSNPIKNPYAVEKILHKEFSEENIGGEWFSSVNIEKIKSTVENMGFLECEQSKYCIDEDKIKKMARNMSGIELITDKRDLSDIKHENIELERFLCSVSGSDVPNVYSDLIYKVLFEKNTEELRKHYKCKKYESFRNYLSVEENKKIEAYTSIVVNLINLYKDISEIEFVLNKLK